MAINNDSIVITDTATSLVSANSDRFQLTITNNGESTVYIGNDASVTDTNGFPIVSAGTYKDTAFLGQYYIICASGETSAVSYIEEDNS